ncbi:MAG TPA: hypothetical protein VGR90_00490 [Acidimicrobiales bacterium]|nr:hypothetical protein [Acidimicrobiales bacterium]
MLPLPAFSAAIELPAGTFHPNLKIPAVESVAGDRPLAWIDDMFLPEAWTWAADRPQPTLLVSVDPALGLTEEIVDKLQAWVGGVR